MTFKEFLALDELTGHLGPVSSGSQGSVIGSLNRLHRPVLNKGTSVSRLMSAGKVKNPARPAGLTSFNKPMTIPSMLG